MHLRLSWIAPLLLVAACASSRGPDSRPIAEDCVCRYYGDMACVCVRVDGSTPRAEYKRKTYYFCCEECREKFLKEPEKFLQAN